MTVGVLEEAYGALRRFHGLVDIIEQLETQRVDKAMRLHKCCLGTVGDRERN